MAVGFAPLGVDVLEVHQTHLGQGVAHEFRVVDQHVDKGLGLGLETSEGLLEIGRHGFVNVPVRPDGFGDHPVHAIALDHDGRQLVHEAGIEHGVQLGRFVGEFDDEHAAHQGIAGPALDPLGGDLVAGQQPRDVPLLRPGRHILLLDGHASPALQHLQQHAHVQLEVLLDLQAEPHVLAHQLRQSILGLALAVQVPRVLVRIHGLHDLGQGTLARPRVAQQEDAVAVVAFDDAHVVLRAAQGPGQDPAVDVAPDLKALLAQDAVQVGRLDQVGVLHVARVVEPHHLELLLVEVAGDDLGGQVRVAVAVEAVLVDVVQPIHKGHVPALPLDGGELRVAAFGEVVLDADHLGGLAVQHVPDVGVRLLAGHVVDEVAHAVLGDPGVGRGGAEVLLLVDHAVGAPQVVGEGLAQEEVDQTGRGLELPALRLARVQERVLDRVLVLEAQLGIRRRAPHRTAHTRTGGRVELAQEQAVVLDAQIQIPRVDALHQALGHPVLVHAAHQVVEGRGRLHVRLAQGDQVHRLHRLLANQLLECKLPEARRNPRSHRHQLLVQAIEQHEQLVRRHIVQIVLRHMNVLRDAAAHPDLFLLLLIRFCSTNTSHHAETSIRIRFTTFALLNLAAALRLADIGLAFALLRLPALRLALLRLGLALLSALRINAHFRLATTQFPHHHLFVQPTHRTTHRTTPSTPLAATFLVLTLIKHLGLTNALAGH